MPKNATIRTKRAGETMHKKSKKQKERPRQQREPLKTELL